MTLRNYKAKIACSLSFVFGITVSIYAQHWQLVRPAYTTADAFVAGFSANDYGASGDGITEVTRIFQDLIDELGAMGGGTLFVPEGKYVINGNLILRKGVILRGEWEKPVKGQTLRGTILMAYAGRGNENSQPFITMEPSSAVQDMTIWYPEQNSEYVTAYSPTIMIGLDGYFGNDYCNVKNTTLVNSYSGVILSPTNSGGSPVINGIYGTPLSRGVEIDHIYDVGRIENIHFSPSYWEDSGLPGAPSAGSTVRKWLLSNATGIVMRRNDWSYTCFTNIEGYNKGMHIGPSIGSPGAGANGHYYNLTFTKCNTGIYFETTSDVGIMFARIKIKDCTNGITIRKGVRFPVQLHTCEITATNNAITTEAGSDVKLMMQKCIINRGQVIISGGIITASDCDFNDHEPKRIIIGENARVAFTGNRFIDPSAVENNSLSKSFIDHRPQPLPNLPLFTDTLPRNQKPSRLVMYNAAADPFNARNDSTDNTSAIQNTLDAAHADGGGIVFLPPGKYKVFGTLTVPPGVELKGAVDIGTSPMGPGSVLEIYSGRGNALGTPFITLSAGSGLRGIVFDYPEQLGDSVPAFIPYPYCIQVAGSDVYIVNIGMRAAYQGIDLFNNTCDNHYLDFIFGCVLQTGIKVGGNSTGGNISNLQFNPNSYAFGFESKWGGWSNAPSENKIPDIYNYVKDNLTFLELDNCSNETLYNDFHYGSQRGLILSGASGISLGLGIDGSRKSIVINSIGASGFDFINSQIVSIDNLPGSCYIETQASFTSQTTFFNSDYWGWTKNAISQAGGTLNFQQANFQYPGSIAFANITGGNTVMNNSAVRPVNLLLASGGEPHFSADASILDPSGINEANCVSWMNNLSNVTDIDPKKLLERNGWTATASHKNGDAGLGIDGNTSSRWDTGIPQAKGQWYKVDMKVNQTFNAIILDAVESPADFPIGYIVFVSTNGINWTEVASGSGNSGMTVINFATQYARYIKIIQMGRSDTWWWSINEYYVLNSAVPRPVTGIEVTPTALSMGVGESYTLTGTIFPNNATSNDIRWSSDNTSVATVNASGFVRAVSLGSAVISAKVHKGGEIATAFVQVSESNMNVWETLDGNRTATAQVAVASITGVSEINSAERMFRIYPNPVIFAAYFDYDLRTASQVHIVVYSAQGIVVKSENQNLVAGAHQAKVNVGDLNPGIYLIRFDLNGSTVTDKIIIIR